MHASIATSLPHAASVSLLPANLSDEIRTAASRLADAWPRGFVSALPFLGDSSDPIVPPPLASLGFIRAAEGEDRVAFFHGSGWCLKVPKERGCEWATRRELAILDRMAVDDRRLFAETYKMPGDILLQRTYAVDAVRFDAFERRSNEIVRAQWRLRITDITPLNIGWTPSGEWVFIDWAGKNRSVEFLW